MCVDMGDTTLVRAGRPSYTSYERIRPYMARFTENRWTSAIIPALLIHIPIGTVYCWSVFKQLIADRLHASPASVEWGFSLAIFFLGMSAAFAGPMVEKNIKKSALVSMVCFVVGFAGTGVSIALNFLPGVFICYGAIMGIGLGVGLGVGYLTPVKNLMLWFADNKGLATGIAVAGFGLAKAIASPLMEYLIGTVGLVSMFFILAAVYAVMMFVGFLLIKRPAGWVYDPATSHVSRKTILKKPVFWGIWIAFYINITCGLALISQEKDILHDVLRAFPQYANLSPRQVCRRHLRHHRTGARRGLRVQHGWPRGLLHTLRPPEAPRDRLSGNLHHVDCRVLAADLHQQHRQRSAVGRAGHAVPRQRGLWWRFLDAARAA